MNWLLASFYWAGAERIVELGLGRPEFLLHVSVKCLVVCVDL